MNVVYLFHSNSEIRIPFFGGNRYLFNLLSSRYDGKWDIELQEFIFKPDIDAEGLSKILHEIPCVRVLPPKPPLNENSCHKFQVFGFFDHTWENSALIPSIPSESGREPSAECNAKQPVQNHPFSFPVKPSLPEKLSEVWRSKLETSLRSRKYSRQTQDSYIYYNRLICRTLQKTPEEIHPDDVTEFLAIIEKDKNYSSSSMNLAISAIKYFFRNVLKNDSISEQHRPRHDERLPMVLSKEEIRQVLSMESNPKHRLLLMLVYSSGLRVSEVVALKKEHIDLSRRVIYIKQSKGRKDRSTLLSERAAAFIEEYCGFFDIQKWLFPGQIPSRPLTIRSAQHIFDKAIRRAGITKKITIHGLRHTFATHLLESGTDIRYIQTLLGHASLRTTERYTHVARRSVLNIKSPLDSIP
ncbi:MAG: tyrosine-type recombinase/integrase [Treponema sp.]|nr:tyrosine-type recombinase/integrase [Treponema sp.]